jgi:hypothetical protein
VSTQTQWAQFKYKGDVWYDGILTQVRYDTREAWMFLRPSEYLDIKIGRQVLTWGTGDLVFLNDLFPKDWQSFFIGRDAEYLKAPSESVKVSLFSDILNADFVFTPLFASDRFITGQYVSYWNGSLGHLAGNESELDYEKPDQWFTDAEYAARLYRTVGAYELALYGYFGFWKNPGGIATSGEYIFPRLNVYGASARGPVAGGIGTLRWPTTIPSRTPTGAIGTSTTPKCAILSASPGRSAGISMPASNTMWNNSSATMATGKASRAISPGTRCGMC